MLSGFVDIKPIYTSNQVQIRYQLNQFCRLEQNTSNTYNVSTMKSLSFINNFINNFILSILNRYIIKFLLILEKFVIVSLVCYGKSF